MTTKPAHNFMNVHKSGVELNKHQLLAEANILRKKYMDFGTGSIRHTFTHIRPYIFT